MQFEQKRKTHGLSRKKTALDYILWSYGIKHAGATGFDKNLDTMKITSAEDAKVEIELEVTKGMLVSVSGA
jgi:hypothetical protein